MRITKLVASLPLAILAMASAREARAFCPSYSPASAFNDHDCAIQAYPGQNPSIAEWNSIFDLVSQGPLAWGSLGPSVKDIGQGCGKPEPLHSVPARFPCELLKAIARNESGWRQFCVPDLPADQVGGSSRTIISFDCGYGVAQVTSGMHEGENPGFDRDRVAKEPIYNLATGTRILGQIWAQAKCVGDNQPAIIEDWYTATWAYNGYAYVNNPHNPNYDANRGVWNPAIGGGAPYQERIFGFIEHTGGQWAPTELAYPNLGDISGTSMPGTLPEPNCASPTNCTSSREVHRTACDGAGGAGGSGAGGAGGAGGSGVASSGMASSAVASSGAGGGSAGAGGEHAGTGGSDGVASAASAASAASGAGTGQGQGEGPVVGCSCHLGKASNTSAMAAVALWVAGLTVLRFRRKAS